MTVWGYDLYHGNGRFDHAAARAAGFRFCYAKATEGNTFQDPEFGHNREASLDAGLYFAGYHWLRSTSSPASQARNLSTVLGKHKKRTPIIIDVEPVEKDGKRISEPTLRHVRQFMSACEEDEIHVSMLYFPRWYWHDRGEPGLAKLPPLINSHYTDQTEPERPDRVYPGDNSERWRIYGGSWPQILQFSELGIVGPHKPICLDAFRGDPVGLSRWFFRRDMDDLPVPEPTKGVDVDWNEFLNMVINPAAGEEREVSVRRALRDAPLVKAHLRVVEDRINEIAQDMGELGSKVDELAAVLREFPELPEIPTLPDIAGVVETEVIKCLSRLQFEVTSEE